jgi:hypothetical protein
MSNEEIVKKIESVRLCMMAHPDNEEHSEFADRIDDLTEITRALSLGTVSNILPVDTSLTFKEWKQKDFKRVGVTLYRHLPTNNTYERDFIFKEWWNAKSSCC